MARGDTNIHECGYVKLPTSIGASFNTTFCCTESSLSLDSFSTWAKIDAFSAVSSMAGGASAFVEELETKRDGDGDRWMSASG